MRFVPRIEVHAVQGNGFKWATVLPSFGGQACPRCGVCVIGDNHRAQHHSSHGQLDALDRALRELIEAVRVIATALEGEGIIAKVRGGETREEPDEAPALDGFVIGSGELPPETRGGED